MITKAIVEEIVSPFQVKIRIPVLDGAKQSQMSTKTEDLNIATICSLPNCYINLQVGDIVFVGFEDNTYYKAVVLGHLSREAMSETYADVNFGSLNVHGSTNLSLDTQIGEVSSYDLQNLKGTSENIQKQLDAIKDELASIYKQLQGG